MSVTPDQFRRLALALPEALESAHMGTPDFRVRGRIFATLPAGANAAGVLKFTPEQQALFMHVDPAAFVPVDGSWGRRGWTRVSLRAARARFTGDALTTAWRNVAPKKLVAAVDAAARD